MKRKIVSWILSAGILFSAGCQWIEQPSPMAQEPSLVSSPAPAPSPAGSAALERRFAEGPSGSDAVQSAIMWSEKYDKLSETANQLRDRNMQLFEENTQLKKETEDLRRRLAQTQKELDEASEFLQKMHVELNQWKADVLGFREELRKAQAAQLQALGKILRILGAESVETGGTTN